ncbi:MAG: hypothetical protein R3F37_19915 [Candidatus Competibacteraceae bacterium]
MGIALHQSDEMLNSRTSGNTGQRTPSISGAMLRKYAPSNKNRQRFGRHFAEQQNEQGQYTDRDARPNLPKLLHGKDHGMADAPILKPHCYRSTA